MKMKPIIKLLGILIASITLVACGGGGSDPVKTEKVWKLVEKIEPGTFGPVKTTFEYDGSGKLIKQNNINSGDYVEFNYDDKGMLLTREGFLASREITEHVEFDSHGEVTLRSLSDNNGALVTDITYVNTYDDERIALDEMPRHSYFWPYPGSKLVTRERGGLDSWFERYVYEENKVTTRWFDTSNDTVVFKMFQDEYNEQGDIILSVSDSDGDGPRLPVVRGNYDYTYTLDENGNISERVTTEGNQSSTTTFKWETFDIPVKLE